MEEYLQKVSDFTHIPKEFFMMLLVLILGFIVLKVLLRTEKKMLRKSVLDPSAYVAVTRATSIAVWVMIILSMLAVTGINMTPILTVLVSAGMALALALRDSLSNVAGGIIILFSRPFVKGDEIVVDNTDGIVDYIDLMFTRLHTFSNQDIIIPNSKLVNSIIVNKTKYDLVRVDCKFTVSYDSDLEKVKNLLNNIVKEGDLLLEKPAPVIGVSKHDKYGVVWDMFVWTHKEDRFKAAYYLGEEVKRVFDANEIRIPFPTLDVKIEGENADK